jgi:hypothetical protein
MSVPVHELLTMPTEGYSLVGDPLTIATGIGGAIDADTISTAGSLATDATAARTARG